jgi:hypothetical protein
VKDIDRLMLFRNRIVHMSYQERPGKYKSLLNVGQFSSIAKLARERAQCYLDFLNYEFGELNLPIPTIRPARHFDSDLEYA